MSQISGPAGSHSCPPSKPHLRFPSPTLGTAVPGRAGGCPPTAKSWYSLALWSIPNPFSLRASPVLAPERLFLSPYALIRADSLAHSRCSAWNEGVPQRIWPPCCLCTLCFHLVCMGEVPSLGQALQDAVGVPHSVNLRLWRTRSLPSRPATWCARVSRRPRREEGAGACRRRKVRAACVLESLQVRGRTSTCR